MRNVTRNRKITTSQIKQRHLERPWNVLLETEDADAEIHRFAVQSL
ncbi:MAG: hypothetical protein ACJ73V_14725 [Acidimicrobiia bacterium]